MTKFVCGILLTCILLTMCVNVLRKANQVEEPMYFQEIINYLGSVPHIENTVAQTVADAQGFLEVFSKYFGFSSKITNWLDEKQDDDRFWVSAGAKIGDVVLRIAEELVMAIEGLCVATILGFKAIPFAASILREFVYLARIVVYLCFDVPLIN